MVLERERIDFTNTARGVDQQVTDELQRLLMGIRHGSVTLIVQDGRVVQIDATQKVRFAGRPPMRQPVEGIG